MKKIIICSWAIIVILSLAIVKLTCMETTVDYGAPKGALEVIAARRSVRKYLEKPVENEKVLAMLRAGMAAPSGKDLRPWEFVMVTESVVLQAMAAGLPYAKMLAGAPLAIVVCGDTARSAYWYLDCSAAAQNVLLAAEAQGLGAVWTAAYPYDDRVAVVREALHLPENVVPLCVIPVGYPATNAAPKDKFNFAKVHHERY